MPYIDSNIPKSIFCSVLVDKFLRIARNSPLDKIFNEKAAELLNKMKEQGAQSLRCRKELSKMIPRHKKVFANFGKNVIKFALTFIFKLES